ncbi:MAG: hypothetical protein WDZ72_07190, partial [Cyclobacteriaceae bacterium]
AIISGLVLLTLITLLRYQININEHFVGNSPNHSPSYSVYKNYPLDTTSITAFELPTKIQQVIKLDSLIGDLKIMRVKRISDKKVDYYDVCFQDTDNFEIMVLYDKNGVMIGQ